MELSILKKPSLVVAFDIGSTNSGYAWQWRGNFQKNRSNIEFNDQWGTASPRLRKTTTCLLLNEGKEIDSFGQLAEKTFFSECDRAEGQPLTGKWYFFKHFKMSLYNEDDPNDLQVEDHFGQHMPLIEVMSKFIQALREHFLKMMQTKGQKVNLKETLWVITVPAIWSDVCRKFMSVAAEMAGICRRYLLIALEPEAAAIHCINLPPEEKVAMGNFGEKGDTFLTVDFGGGTTDVQALHVRGDGSLEEVSIGGGDRVGGQNINDAFFQACCDAFEGGVWIEVTQKCQATEILEMENDFESKKVAIGTDGPRNENMALIIPDSWRELMKEGKIKLKVGNEKRFEVRNGKMYFNSEFIREFLFDETVKRMLKVLGEILQREQVQQVKHVILVGGFTESPIVIEKTREFLREKFPGRKVFVPTSPLSAVMSGAVLFGHDPFIFYQRICRATYGVATNTLFDPAVHREDKKWLNKEDNLEYCKDVLSVHVEKGTSVKLGEKLPTQSYFPVYKDQTIVPIPIYMFTEQNLTGTVYTTDENCKKLGQIEVEMLDTSGGTNRKITVTMIYGGTELDVTARNEVTGTEYKSILRFDTS